MPRKIAVITMVRDDPFFLAKWVNYYGTLFGRKNLYVINHGYGEEVSDLAAGCNVIGIPGHHQKKFDAKRWRLFNGLISGLRNYYDQVICLDVDEFIVLDPITGSDFAEFMQEAGRRRVITPFGLEVIHRRNVETDEISKGIFNTRKHVRFNMHYTKPSIVSGPFKLARGGHYSEYSRLEIPDGLFLFHMKYCDYNLYKQTMNKRNKVAEALDVEKPEEAGMGAHWFAQNRSDDAEFEKFEEMRVSNSFDFSDQINDMHSHWRKRGDKGLWHFDRYPADNLNVLPERFAGIL